MIVSPVRFVEIFKQLEVLIIQPSLLRNVILLNLIANKCIFFTFGQL